VNSPNQEEKLADLLSLSKDWMLRLTHSQAGHYKVSEYYFGSNSKLSALVILLSAFVSCTIFFDSLNVTLIYLKTAGGLAAIATSIFASVQAFAKPGERAELHRITAARYGTLKRSLELRLVGGFEDQNEAKNFLRTIADKWADIADDAPVTPNRFRKLTSEQLKYEKMEHKELAKIS
jgi:hypothetical protein